MADTVTKDTGLGFSEFLASATPTPTAETTPVTEEVKAEVKEVEPTVTEPKIEESKTEVTSEVKVEDKTEVKTEEKPSVNWEDDSNVYKKRHKDAAKWANQVHQQNLALQQQLEIINKKLDGTYDPAKDMPPPIDPQAIAQESEFGGRIAASRESAFEIYGKGNIEEGKKIVEQTLWADNAPFRQIEQHPMVQMRIMGSSSPVLEAMKIVKEYAFYQKFGNTPELIEESIKKAYEKEIEDRVTKKVLDKVKLKEEQVKGIGEVRSASVGGSPPAQNPTPPLSEIFGGR